MIQVFVFLFCAVIVVAAVARFVSGIQELREMWNQPQPKPTLAVNQRVVLTVEEEDDDEISQLLAGKISEKEYYRKLRRNGMISKEKYLSKMTQFAIEDERKAYFRDLFSEETYRSMYGDDD